MRTRAKGITKEVITAIAIGGLVIGTAGLGPGFGYLIKEINDKKFRKAKSDGRLTSTIKRLENQKLLSWKEINGQTILTLTDKGVKRKMSYDFQSMQLKKGKAWDGLYRVVIFDIPEKKKRSREVFRKKLSELNFRQIQKSVYVTKNECIGEIDFLRHFLEIPQYVTYILAKQISSFK